MGEILAAWLAPTNIVKHWRRSMVRATEHGAPISAPRPSPANRRLMPATGLAKGPWVNAKGVQVAANLDELHDQSKVNINADTGVAENGRLIPNRRFSFNMHDILTGSTLDGRAYPPGKDMTCGNWTKNDAGRARIGHFDRMSRENDDGGAIVEFCPHVSRLQLQKVQEVRRRRTSVLLCRAIE